MKRLTQKNYLINGESEAYVYGGIEYYGDSYGGEVIDKLAEYEDAEEQGLLLRFPCKVGDMLYHISSYYNVVIPVRLNDIIVSFAGIDNYPKQYNCCSFDECSDVYEDFEFDNSDFGKTVFLTEEEAEQVLKQMKGE